AGIWTTLTGRGEIYFDSVVMFAFFLLAGRYLERRARQRTVESTARLVNLLPPSTLRVTVDGGTERILLEEVREGDLLEVKPGGPGTGSLPAPSTWKAPCRSASAPSASRPACRP